ncbi:hypothetical protein [Aureimonas leprariae]|uniref:Lipoprotein n=1 Tax=Plantimonas leprariae TaxID=2615207 RepID=A0A7V7PNX9_9HYPH|nr:hypothetical protein [Aureimonas leprariae]KAB0679567.1 hypothetical protein F6X38_12135 [Aureimonas leprariae]
MPVLRPRIALALAAISALAACNSTREAADIPAAPHRPQSVDTEGVVPEYCPKISLRENTAILRKGEIGKQQYIASITQTTRECHVLNGELYLKVGVSGRVVAGPAGEGGTAALPIRVAVVSGADTLYSNRGTQSVAYAQGSPGRFVYVDEAIRVPEPPARNYAIFVGFDEGK